jgi:hypothetical protein
VAQLHQQEVQGYQLQHRAERTKLRQHSLRVRPQDAPRVPLQLQLLKAKDNQPITQPSLFPKRSDLRNERHQL